MGILRYGFFGFETADDEQNLRVDKACGKDNDQQNPSKAIT